VILQRLDQFEQSGIKPAVVRPAAIPVSVRPPAFVSTGQPIPYQSPYMPVNYQSHSSPPIQPPNPQTTSPQPYIPPTFPYQSVGIPVRYQDHSSPPIQPADLQDSTPSPYSGSSQMPVVSTLPPQAKKIAVQYGEDWHQVEIAFTADDPIEKLSNALCTELSIQGPIKIQYLDPAENKYFVLRSLKHLPDKPELKILPDQEGDFLNRLQGIEIKSTNMALAPHLIAL